MSFLRRVFNEGASSLRRLDHKIFDLVDSALEKAPELLDSGLSNEDYYKAFDKLKETN